MIDYESQSARTLLAIASRRSGIDAERCSLAFEHLGAADRWRRRLHSTLVRHRLSSLQFAVLVVLFDMEPEPIPMAVLAEHTAVSRSAVTDAVDKLEALRWASRNRRDGCDRRVTHVRISTTGREKVDQAINDYLHIAMDAARYIDGPENEKRFRLSAGKIPDHRR